MRLKSLFQFQVVKITILGAQYTYNHSFKWLNHVKSPRYAMVTGSTPQPVEAEDQEFIPTGDTEALLIVLGALAMEPIDWRYLA